VWTHVHYIAGDSLGESRPLPGGEDGDRVSVIEARALSKRFGPVLAVHQLSFEVAAGSVTGFLGPNGAGKTTTLRMLLGLVRPDSGTATIAGRRYRDLADRSHVVGAALEAASFHPGRTARDHLRVRALAGRVGKTRIEEVLEMTGLHGAAGRRVSGFSLGMRQRLGLASALLGDPQVLILDEPANGLDPEGIRWLRGLLRNLAGEGRTVLVSSHALAEAAQTVDHVVVISRGRLVTQAPLSELTTQASPVVRIRTPDPARLQAMVNADGGYARAVAGDRVEVTGSTPERVAMLAAKESIPVVESTTEQASLEDVFFRLTGTAGTARADGAARAGKEAVK
jgi:ABC-2 type transport system ATP-binding protein